MKVRIAGADREARSAAMTELAEALNATVIQKIGHILTLYKRNHAEPRIVFEFKSKKH